MMARRSDQMGLLRSAYQRHLNEKLAATYVENDRGWKIPNTIEEGWDELNRAIYTTRRTLILIKHMSPYERVDSLRSIRFEMARSRACPASSLPDRALPQEQHAEDAT